MPKYILPERLYRRDWIFDSPIGSVGLAYEDYLRRHRYREQTIHLYLAALAHFARWIKSKHIDLPKIDKCLCSQFLASHVPHCACPQPRSLQVANIRAALNHLLVVLVEQGFCPEKKQEPTPVLDELEKFHHYLKGVRGLADNTCQYRLKYIHSFLARKFAGGRVDVAQLTPADIDEFVLDFANHWKPACLGVIRAALRSYLRYRALQGDQTQSLIAIMPVIADWKGSAIKQALTDKELKLFLQSFDLSYSTGQRDYAIARCLLDLGLRGHEVAQLSLESVDWRNGTVAITGSKGCRVQCLPLPVQTGKAVAEYIRHWRPSTSNRSLFVRHVAPFDKPISVCAVRSAMTRAFVRCGLDKEFCSTHVLRHTMAMQLQKSGTSLKEIADLLRHKDIASATVYAKADLTTLKTVALPWPGRRS